MAPMKKEKTPPFLVTGGSGMVGDAMKRHLPKAAYPTRKELDLSDPLVTRRELDNGNWDNGPRFSGVFHLAAKVGGIKSNFEQMGDFFTENLLINTNLLKSCMLSDIPKVVSLLSTCIYPDIVRYPITEEQLHSGPPHPTNYGYSYAKRMLEVQSRAYREQYGCNFVCAVPNNLDGENDNFDLENGHAMPSLIRKIWEAKKENKPSVEVWGDGSPLREFTYSGDIAKILLFLMENYDDAQPVNIGNTEEHSIKEIVIMLCKIFEYDGKIKWNLDKPIGQHRKSTSNKRLLSLGWKEEDYTSLEDGLRKTCGWFVENYPNVRGMK